MTDPGYDRAAWFEQMMSGPLWADWIKGAGSEEQATLELELMTELWEFKASGGLMQ